MKHLPVEQLGALLDEIRTGPFGSSLHASEYEAGGTPVINPQHYAEGVITPDERVAVGPEVAERMRRYRLLEGDVVVARRGEMGRCAVVRPGQSGWLLGTGSAALRPSRRLDPAYLAYFLRSPMAVRTLNSSSVGSTMANLNQKILLSLPCPVPARDEQRRVIGEIEAHFSRIDAAVASLHRAKANVKRARASVLKAAVEGRLVPTEAELARAEGRDYEHASVLLERIVTARRERWASAGRKTRATDAPSKTDGMHQVPPEGWVMTTLGHAFEVEVGATPSRSRPDYWGGPIAWVSSGEVQFCRIKATHETITERGLSNTSTKLHPPGTVLIGMIGQGRTRGQAAILDIEACNNQNCAAIRVSEAGCIPEYVYGWLELQYQETRRLGGGNNQQALNKARVGAIPIPLPPLAEQERIVAEVERRMSVLDAVDATIDANLARCERLRQAILKRAFEGRLVPAEPPTKKAARSALEQLDLHFAQGAAE